MLKIRVIDSIGMEPAVELTWPQACERFMPLDIAARQDPILDGLLYGCAVTIGHPPNERWLLRLVPDPDFAEVREIQPGTADVAALLPEVKALLREVDRLDPLDPIAVMAAHVRTALKAFEPKADRAAPYEIGRTPGTDRDVTLSKDGKPLALIPLPSEDIPEEVRELAEAPAMRALLVEAKNSLKDMMGRETQVGRGSPHTAFAVVDAIVALLARIDGRAE